MDQVNIKLTLARTEKRLHAVETDISDLKSDRKDVRNEVKVQGKPFQADLNQSRNAFNRQDAQLCRDLCEG